MEDNTTPKHSTKFEDGTVITDYLATAYCEGFCEGESASEQDALHAWSYMIGTKLYRSLQGWFGRTVAAIIEQELITEEGEITEKGKSLLN